MALRVWRDMKVIFHIVCGQSRYGRKVYVNLYMAKQKKKG